MTPYCPDDGIRFARQSVYLSLPRIGVLPLYADCRFDTPLPASTSLSSILNQETMSTKKESAPEMEMLTTQHGTYRTTLSAKYKSRVPWHAKDPRQICSFIPGTITTVEVQEGDSVKAGDVLLSFKAMKMQNIYRSPVSGRIAKVHVSPGDVVAKGILLVEFE